MDSIHAKHGFCGKSLAECIRTIEAFHGWKAPGIILGLVMVDWARELIGSRTEADAIVETRHCLPDAIQLFTPCTVGNGWMKILDWDKFALTLYDRMNRNGYRVSFELDKARAFPDLYNWFMRLVPKNEVPMEILAEIILSADRAVLSARPMQLTDFHQRYKKSEIRVCPTCAEAFAASQGETCLACQGEGYFTVQGVKIEAPMGKTR